MTKHAGRLITWMMGLLVSGAAAQGSFSEELFPVPEQLRKNVEFWKKIYTVYPTTTVLIHDMDDMSIIYEAVDLATLGPNLSYRQQLQQIEKIKDEYRAILQSLAHRQFDPTSNNPRVARVLGIFGTDPDPARVEQAAQSLRGQLGIKDRFYAGVQRSGLYLDAISMTFAQYGLPIELSMLPHVESSFNYRAYSKVGAAGIWQFMRHTGRLFMTINYDIDERLDPIRATEAAAKLLQLNYSELGSWPLAITAYNHGLNGMKRAKAQFGDDFGRIYQEYESRSFGFASRNFYAQFLAAVEVGNNHERFFGPIQLHSPAEFVELQLEHYLTVNRVLDLFGLDHEEFAELNPALRPPVLKSQRRIPKGYTLRIPTRLGLDSYALAARLGQTPQFEQQVESDWYRVQRGDNLQSIASRFNVSAGQLAEYNNLANPGRIQIGLILRIPPASSGMLASARPAAPATTPDLNREARALPPAPSVSLPPAPEKVAPRAADLAAVTVPATDAASAVEETAPVSREEREAVITHDLEPALRRPATTSKTELVGKVGETVPFTQPPRPTEYSEWIVVEPEETLGHYATWLEVSARRLRELNGLRYNQDIHIGQRIRLTYERVSAEEFENRRFEYQRSIQEDFFSTYQVESVQNYAIRRGQNIWQICNDVFNVPMWLITKYNPDRDLTRLQPGDEISVPMVVAINPSATPPALQE